MKANELELGKKYDTVWFECVMEFVGTEVNDAYYEELDERRSTLMYVFKDCGRSYLTEEDVEKFILGEAK